MLVIPDLLPPSVLEPLIGELQDFLGRKAAEEEEAGRLPAGAAAELAALPDLGRRAAELCAALGEPPAHMPPTLSEVSQKSHTTAGMFSLMTHPNMLDTAASVFGHGEILVHPQFNLRGMLPEAQGILYHQDLAFLESDGCEDTLFANFWIPLCGALWPLRSSAFLDADRCF